MMARSLIGALALALLPYASAFRDTSPLFVFSTSELLIPGAAQAEFAKASTVSSNVLDSLKLCHSSTYIIVHQAGVSSADYADSRAAPRLGLYMGGNHSDIRTTYAVPEVYGTFDKKTVFNTLLDVCHAKYVKIDGDQRKITEQKSSPDGIEFAPKIIDITFPAAPLVNRVATLNNYDAYLEEIITGKPTSPKYTVIYMTTPSTESAEFQTQHTYEMEDPFEEAVHMELKRDTSVHKRADPKNNRGLFEKYQYLSPGLFMGIAAIIPLFLIAYVGVTAISNLEVSYFAFSKEMGPAGQKKQ